MKYPRTYHLPYSPGATNDDKINDKNNLIGKHIVITEKLDGENSAMTDDGVYARSHVSFTKSEWSKEIRKIHEEKVRYNLGQGVYLFGENLEGIHSINYNNLKSYFYIFGIRDNNIWVSWETVEEYSYLLDIPVVPVLFNGILNTEDDLKLMINDLMDKPSELGGEKEGIVIRNAGIFHNDYFYDNVLKYVRKDHVKTDIHWTKNWKKSKLKI